MIGKVEGISDFASGLVRRGGRTLRYWQGNIEIAERVACGCYKAIRQVGSEV
jgi:hypothetical protein